MDGADVQAERWIEQGRQALLRGNPRGALDPLRRALTTDPENAIAHILLARALLDLHRVAAALVEANAGILYAAESADAHAILGDVLYAQRDLRAAERHYESAREFDPHRPGPLRGLAHIAAFFDQDARALELLTEALALDPENTDTLVSLANHHLHRGALAEAETYADRALEREPEHLRALVVKGFVELRRGDVASAREHARWALRNDATDRDAITLLAAVKARESLLLGLWYRANAAVISTGARSVLLLVGAYFVTQLTRLVLHDLGFPRASLAVSWLWLGVCYYSYVGPGLFRRMVQKEIASVRLDKDF